MPKNEEYTDLWVSDEFNQVRVDKYNNKFKKKWEKNIKHRQQLRFINKHMKPDMYWCDFPVGSGRLMDELETNNMLGVDISESFLEYNREKGRHCEKGDLLDNKYNAEFDLVTSLHTIPAFTQCKDIMLGYIKSLKPGGLLIIDLPHEGFEEKEEERYRKLGQLKKFEPVPCAMSVSEIETFFEGNACEILEMVPHDFWDHPRFIRWKNEGGRGEWLLTKIGLNFEMGACFSLHS